MNNHQQTNATTIAREVAEERGISAGTVFSYLKRGIATQELRARKVEGRYGGLRYYVIPSEARDYLNRALASFRPRNRSGRTDVSQLSDSPSASEIVAAFPDANLFTVDDVNQIVAAYRNELIHQRDTWGHIAIHWAEMGAQSFYSIASASQERINKLLTRAADDTD